MHLMQQVLSHQLMNSVRTISIKKTIVPSFNTLIQHGFQILVEGGLADGNLEALFYQTFIFH